MLLLLLFCVSVCARRRLRVQAGDINSAVAIMILARGGGGEKGKKNGEREYLGERVFRGGGEREREREQNAYTICALKQYTLSIEILAIKR